MKIELQYVLMSKKLEQDYTDKEPMLDGRMD
jgi:hypothetical protein